MPANRSRGRIYLGRKPRKETGREDRFYNAIKGRIICEARINWPEAKRKLLSK